MSNVIPLRVSEATGPREYQDSETGAPVEFSTPCTVCRGDIVAAQSITYFRGWAHTKCVTDALLASAAGNAWLVLGAQLARRPSYFTATETKAIVEQLLRLAGDLPVDMWHPGGADLAEQARRGRQAWATS